MIALDIECYSDYFLVMFKHLNNNEVRYFEIYPDHDFDRANLLTVMNKYPTVSFNGISYDLPLIVAAIEGFPYDKLYNLSKEIITSNKPSYSICKKNNIHIPRDFDHIDLINVAPGVASLKLYGGRLHAPKMQDLPIPPDAKIVASDRVELREYCENDLDTTILLYNTLRPQIALRESMSDQYNIDLRSKSDAQIAEAVIKSELEKKTKRKFKPPKIKGGYAVRYRDPGIVEFNDPKLTAIFERLLKHDFTFLGNGSIKLPDWLKDTDITINGAKYRMGIGGLHSCEKKQYIEAGDGILCDWDVASYYPSIILEQRLAPAAMGKDFLELYQSIVTRRLEAKAKMKSIEDEINVLEKELEEL